MSISPKLANSTPVGDDPRDPTGQWAQRHEARRINLDSLQRLIDDYPQRQLKFVVASPADIDEIDALLTRLTGWSPEDILLMPEGVMVPKPGSTVWITDLCLARAWRFCPRLHIQLFGNIRGT